MAWAEWLGYAASAAIVVSLAMTSVVRLRVISLVGSLLFVVYGTLIQAWPVVVSNAIIAALNVWFLARELRARKDVGMTPIAADAPYLADFLDAHRAEIAQTQPGFTGVGPDAMAWLLTRDGLPAGVLAGRLDGDTLHVDLDYVTPAYRDSRLGRWLYAADGPLRGEGVAHVTSEPGGGRHRGYLASMGFRPAGDGRLARDL